MKLRFTEPALADLDDILSYIRERSPKGADSVSRRIEELLIKVLDAPGMGSPTERPRQRRLVALPYPYLIFYEVTETEIIVHAVRHGHREHQPDR